MPKFQNLIVTRAKSNCQKSRILLSQEQAWMAEEGGEESLLAMIGADPKQLAEAGELDSPRNSTG